MTAGHDLRALSRRHFLRAAAVGGAGGLFMIRLGAAVADGVVTMPFANGERRLVQFPQKRPLILLTMRPPQLETPEPIAKVD